MAMVFSVESFGQPPLPWRPPARVIIRHPVPPPSRVIVKLPPGYLRVVVGGVGFFFYNGFFYQQDGGKYVVVRAPIGATVTAIPDGFVTFVSGGITYYFYEGIYYRKVPSGYEVVDTPPDAVIVYESTDKVDESPGKATPTPAIDERVSVTAQILNVRSGPGKDHPVIEHVDQGNVLIIKGTSPGWYYVKLPNGKYGWVDQEYTNPYSPPASG